MVLAGYSGFASASMGSGSLAYAQKFQGVRTADYIQAVFVGRGSTAILLCGSRIVTKLVFSHKIGAHVFFHSSAAIGVVAVILLVISSRTPFSKSRSIKPKGTEKEAMDIMLVLRKIWKPAAIAYGIMLTTFIVLPIFLVNVPS